MAAIGRRLGTPLTPMQSYVADVGTERLPDGSYAYPVVVWTVPRQTGKTTGLRAIGTHRALVAGRDVWYTAQTGKDARARWLDLVTILRADPMFKERIDVALRNGAERVGFPGGAGFHVFAPTPDSLHSYTPPCVFIDEAFALAPGAGDLLMGAISPGQVTLVDKQIWIVSTAGTAASTFLHEWIDRAAAGEPGVALFDWGATDEQDPYDLGDIAAFHPGVGFDFNGKVLTAHDVLAEANRNTRAEYERAYANRRTVTTSHLIPLEVWRRLAAPGAEPPPGRVVLTYDVAADRQSSAMLATWAEEETGTVHTTVIAAAAGVAWLPDAVASATGILRPVLVGAAENGPVLEVTATLRARGHQVRTITEREYATAAGGFLTHIDEATLRHGGTPDGTDVLSRSVTGLVTRAGAVDGVAFSRRHSVGDSSPGVAAALGVHLIGLEPTTRPAVYFSTS